VSGLLPKRSPVDETPPRRTVDFESAGGIFAALASETARSVLEQLYSSPAPASEIAAAVGISIQNAEYHLERLATAGLIKEADTWYGENGHEMAVYAPVAVHIVCAPNDDSPGASGVGD
jgi:DNA-binding transcriptional ArsR family regulator